MRNLILAHKMNETRVNLFVDIESVPTEKKERLQRSVHPNEVYNTHVLL